MPKAFALDASWTRTFAAAQIACENATTIWTIDSWANPLSLMTSVTSSSSVTMGALFIPWTETDEECRARLRAQLPPVETPEEIRARVRRLAERKAEELEREAAKERARNLLCDHLSPKQEEDLRVRGYFDVVVNGRSYRIRRGGHGGWVERMDGQRATDGYCIYLQGECPAEDNMLAQKLLLETDEAEFLRIANRTAPRH
jgi:hypothetical protein